MTKLWSAALVVALGLAALGWYAYREHRRHELLRQRVELLQSEAEHRRDLERQAEAAYKRLAMFECDTRYREESDWGELCRRELRKLAELERLLGE